MNATTRRLNPSYGWVVLAVVWLAGFCMPVNMAKGTVLAPVVMQVFQMSPDVLGISISLFMAMGFILAFPAGALLSKFGVKKIINVGLGCAIVGGLIGVFSTGVEMFIVSRFVEGGGFGIMAVCGVAAITPWFAPAKRGIPMGIWAIWVTVGMLLCGVVYAGIYEATQNWQLIWWICIALDVVVMGLFNIFYKAPDFVYDENGQPVYLDEAGSQEAPQPSFAKAFRRPAVWILGLVFFFYGVGLISQNFFTAYLESAATFGLMFGGIIVSVSQLSSVVISPLVGKLSDILRSRKIILLAGIASGLIYTWVFFDSVDPVVLVVMAVLAGFTGGCGPSMIWALSTEIVPQEELAGATASLSFFQTLGMSVGPAAFGMLTGMTGSWGTAARLLFPAAFIIAAILLVVGLRKYR
jgi:MFS family permease